MEGQKSREDYVASRLDRLLRVENITKLEAAQSQLKTACQLFFQTEDSVSVHTLAWSSHETLDRHPKSVRSFLIDIANQSPESAKAHAELTEARDFFKHYYKKPLKTIRLIENLNEWLLIDCGYMYTSITGKTIKEVVAVNTWVSIRRDLPLLESRGVNNVAIDWLRALNIPKSEFLHTFLSQTVFGPEVE